VSGSELYGRWLFELWCGSYSVADEILTEDFVGHWPDREVVGRDALVALIRETRAMFASLSFSLDLGPFGDEILAARWSGVGVEPDVQLVGHDLLRVVDGRFAEYWVVTWNGSS
jgi:hypothetical protein